MSIGTKNSIVNLQIEIFRVMGDEEQLEAQQNRITQSTPGSYQSDKTKITQNRKSSEGAKRQLHMF